MEEVKKIDFEKLKIWLKPRAKNWHKGMSGHVLVVGGELGYSGAPPMAGEAALRVGAGLVSIASKPDNALVMNTQRPELMCYGVEQADGLGALLNKATVIVLGPGLGQTAWSQALWEEVIAYNKPLLVDADGLNILAKRKHYREDWVLTPHVGEAARLLNLTTKLIQQDRLAAANEIVKQYGGICVLKGEGSLVASVNKPLAICDRGNPGMASAGMGDVLSGVIGGLIAQGVPMREAAELGVYLHAMAGDEAAKENGERGLIATDLYSYLHKLSNPT